MAIIYFVIFFLQHFVSFPASWIWVGGSNTRNQKPSVRGSQVYPGSRKGATSWLDKSGTRVWIFGGLGYGVERSSSIHLPTLNELWSFDVETKDWSLADFHNGTGLRPPPCSGCVSCNYKHQAVLFGATPLTWMFNMVEEHWSSHNLTRSPIPRSNAAYWCDAENGTLWIFGGVSSKEELGDFWQFSFKNMEWREMKPMTNKSSFPPKCHNAATWIHPSGKLYMFGGSYHAHVTADFWVFSPVTSVWMKLNGNARSHTCAGKYGEMGVPSSGNQPGCREGSATWIDEQGDLWLFGGLGFDNYSTTGTALSMIGLLSDLWMFNSSSKVWAWIGGLSRSEGVPFYSEKGKLDSHNLPGPREGAVSFCHGNQLWLFGGAGHDVKEFDGILNDLWLYEKLQIPTPKIELQGDTIHISFALRILVAFVVMALVLVVSVSLCYRKEFKIFRFKRRLHTVVKYKPVKVEMMQVQQPEVPMPSEANNRL